MLSPPTFYHSMCVILCHPPKFNKTLFTAVRGYNANFQSVGQNHSIEMLRRMQKRQTLWVFHVKFFRFIYLTYIVDNAVILDILSETDPDRPKLVRFLYIRDTKEFIDIHMCRA